MQYLLKYFKELTLHPKNAEELKGLILQLAIQGKLTAQWRKDNHDVERASVLLEKIATKKALLIKEKKIKKEKPLTGITEKEIPNALPNNWSWSKLGNTGYTQTGSTPPKKDPEYYGDFIPFIGPADISNQGMKYPVDGLSVKGIAVGRLIPEGSIMMVCIGGSIGKCYINEMDVSCNQQINTITPLLIPSVYIKTVCQSPYFQNEVWEKSSGSATPIINKGKWENIIVPIPPLEEQKAIVATVNQLFQEVAQLEALTRERVQLKADFVSSALQQLTQAEAQETTSQWAFLQEHFGTFFTEKANVKKLRESILQLAVQGKLTNKWRQERTSSGAEMEHASVLLERIKAEKALLIADKKIKKEKPLPAITEDEIPYALPKGWVWCRMGTVTDIIAGASFKSGDFNETGGTKCIKITNAGVREFVETNDFLPESFIKDYPNYLIRSGDLILALTRPYIKDGLKISTCPGSYNNSLLNQRVAAIRSMTEQLHHPYVFSFIQSPNVLNFYKSKFDGKSQQPNMKMGDITDLLFAVPPLAEQKTIVEKVNALMALCDNLENEIETRTSTQENWMQSCLREVLEPIKT